MATYNGEKYINEQLDSIIVQMKSGDEIIISDDGSSDRTVEIINKYISKYSFIKLIKGPQKGFVKNFENAIRHCSNDIVLLCDQDDIWCDNKREVILKVFNKFDVVVVQHRSDFYDESTGEIRDNAGFRNGLYKWIPEGEWHGVVKNIFLSSYIGCMMAVRRDFLTGILPFPDNCLAHDQWIGLCAEKKHKTIFIREKLITRRIHGNNATTVMNLGEKIKFRMMMWRVFYKYWRSKKRV